MLDNTTFLILTTFVIVICNMELFGYKKYCLSQTYLYNSLEFVIFGLIFGFLINGLVKLIDK